MPDSILDDVQALMDKEFGDKRILEQILRAAKNDEVISNFERNYVRKLSEKHLGKKPIVEKPSLEKPVESQKIISTATPEPIPQKPSQPIQTWSKPTKISKTSSKNTKVLLGIGLASLLIIVIAAVSMSETSDLTPAIKTDQTPKTSSSSSFSIKTDQSSYSTGDIISITGSSKINFGSQIELSIKNSDDVLVWTEQVNVKRDGEFTTLTFAGGSGWEKSGTFTIIAQGNSETASNTFSFRK